MLSSQSKRPSRRRRRGRGPNPAAARSAADRPRAPRPRITHEPAEAFVALGLDPELCAAVAASGYDTPTPIQQQTITPILRGRDILGCARTGTGKTAAFALPILDVIHHAKRPRDSRFIRALVLAPTRELASQIGESFDRYAGNTGIRSGVIFGGVGKPRQVRELRDGLDVLVACPGRLLDLIGDREVDLSRVECLVLDEADRMLDMGFVRDVRRIAALTPNSRQTLLFSATMPAEIRSLAHELLFDPVSVAVDPVSSTGAPIEQSVYFVEQVKKAELLIELLGDPRMARTLVFTRTKRGADRVAKRLDRAGISAAAIHGNKSQPQREKALAGFKNGHIPVVVATDIAARGIDVKDVSHVVNYDLPMDPESYVHRVGRTGRAGASGEAFTFCSHDEKPRLAAVEKLTRRRLKAASHPSGNRGSGETRREPRPARGRRSRRRTSR